MKNIVLCFPTRKNDLIIEIIGPDWPILTTNMQILHIALILPFLLKKIILVMKKEFYKWKCSLFVVILFVLSELTCCKLGLCKRAHDCRNKP